METREQEAMSVPAENPAPQVGDTWAIPIHDGHGARAVLAQVLSTGEPGQEGLCKLKVQDRFWKNATTSIPSTYLRQNALVSRNTEVFGPQLQAILFDLQRQVNLLQEVVDRLCDPDTLKLVAQAEQEGGSGE